MLKITELEEDALKELFNLGLGLAADSLSRMVGKEVLLSLPRLSVVNQTQVLELMGEQLAARMVAIRQRFHGGLTGTALLLFPGGKGLELVRTLLGDDIPLESLTELEQETLLDVGNVILNAFLSSFTGMMSQEFEFEHAEFLSSTCAKLLDLNSHLRPLGAGESSAAAYHVEQAFFLIMDFRTDEGLASGNALQGYVVLLFSHQAMEVLREELNRILATLG